MTDRAPLGSWLAAALAEHANTLAVLYGGPIYLVGSALCVDDPGDVDLRCVIDSEDWTRLFGGREKDGTEKERTRLRRWREQLKQSRRLSRSWHYRFDLQFQSPSDFEARTGQRVRVDTMPAYVLDAGRGTP